MKLDLETLKFIKVSFEIQSDHSALCNGYRSLCDTILLEEQEIKNRKSLSAFVCNNIKNFDVATRCEKQCIGCMQIQLKKSITKRKCPICHTLNSELIGKCICGNYIEAIDENTWKEEKYLDMHRKWEDGKLGYNIIYSRLKELGYE